MSSEACARLSRRGVLALPALAGAGAVLSGCGVLKKGGSASSGRSSGAASPRAVATATGPHGGVMIEAEWKGAPLSVEVGPAAVDGNYAVVRMEFTTTSDDKVSLYQAFGSTYRPGTMVAIRMLSLDKGWSIVSWMRKRVIYMTSKMISLWKYFQCFMRRPRMLAPWTCSFLMWVSLRAFRF